MKPEEIKKKREREKKIREKKLKEKKGKKKKEETENVGDDYAKISKAFHMKVVIVLS